MTLSYAWSYDPVFPEAVFADSTVGPVLAALGMRYEDSSNHVPAFTDPTTVAAMLRLDDTMRALLTSVPLSYAPHSLSQPGDALATRTAWVLDSLRPLAYAWQGPNMAIDTLRARITPIIETARHVVVRHALRGPDGTWMPDMTRLAPFFGTSPTPFYVPSGLRALAGGDPVPWHDLHSTRPEDDTQALARASFTATALSFGLMGSLGAHLQAMEPTILDDARVLTDHGSSAFAFAKGRATISLSADATPMPGGLLQEALARNVLLHGTAPNLAHMHQIRAALRVPKGATITADEVRWLLQTVAAFEGPGTLIDDGPVFLPKGWIHQHTAPTGWPVAALLGMDRRTTPSGHTLTATGLVQRLGFACALASTPIHPAPDARALLAITAWLLEDAPKIQTGNTVGAQGEAHYTAHWDASSTLLTWTPLDTMRPQWVLQRVHNGRLAALNKAIDPNHGWKPAWVKERIENGRLAPLNAIVEDRARTRPRPPAPTFDVPLLP